MYSSLTSMTLSVMFSVVDCVTHCVMHSVMQSCVCPVCYTFCTRVLLLLQLALDEAQELMDIAAAGEGGYEGIRQQLAEAYQKAGLADVADFIRAA
jgi:hypothetical protein